uniref:Uncharacterized protein n=1 Tax=Arundo donax TaxID=35708 RepID=A0A0A9GPC4_ARUDO
MQADLPQLLELVQRELGGADPLVAVEVRRLEVGTGGPPREHPSRQRLLPSLGAQLRRVQEEEGHHHRAHRDPRRRERAPGRRREAPVAVPKRRHRRAHAVEGVHGAHPFRRHQERRPGSEDDGQERGGGVELVLDPVRLHLPQRLAAATVAGVGVVPEVDGAEDERLLLLDEVVGGLAEEGADEGHAGEGEGAGEQLGGVAGRDKVAVAHGRHGDHAEVERVEDAAGRAVAGHVVHDNVEGGGAGEEVGEQEEADETEARARAREKLFGRRRGTCSLRFNILAPSTGFLRVLGGRRRPAAPEPSRPSQRRHLLQGVISRLPVV